jgi:signal transduction histidine kinase
MLPVALHAALLAAFVESLGLAGLLLWRARRVTGVAYLVLFLAGVAVWVATCELPSWFGPDVIPVSARLVGVSALTSAVFLHFVLVLCGTKYPARLLSGVYLFSGAVALAALVVAPGRYEAWAGIDYFFMPNSMGWVVGAVWAGLALAGHAVMFLSWLHAPGPQRRRLVAMCLASSWGALCMAGYGFPALGIDLYPYPLLFLPAYPLILVYGILRYQLMIVNAWARRALAWTLLAGLGSTLIAGLAALPLPFGGPNSGWRLWAIAVVALLFSGLLLDPIRRLATRIVYPGAHLADDSVAHWRAELRSAQSFAELAAAARRQITDQLRAPITVIVECGARPETAEGGPALLCHGSDGEWRTDLVGWDAAPPGPLHVAQLFGTVLADAAERVEQVIISAHRERDRQQQQRLAELGALAATVAHDIRNPLNIIAMAAADAPPPLRREIAIQTTRIAQLASDLLDYAKSWQIDRCRVNLSDQIRAAVARFPEIAIDPGLPDELAIEGDPRRLGQIFANLFENARAATSGTPAPIAVAADRDADGVIAVHVCDRGCGVPEEIRGTLFQPFVSRSENGTGLGLAIVAKIMAAHDGSVALTERPGWTTCFTLQFPPAA